MGSIDAQTLGEFRRAYQVLNVPFSASAISIKQSYIRLVKGWHPDLVKEGTSAYGEATLMTQVINESYSRIRCAPLRYCIDRAPLASESGGEGGVQSRSSQENGLDTLPIGNRIEYAFRFACGVVGGFLLYFSLLVSSQVASSSGFLLPVVLIILCGLLAIRLGDKFWHLLLEFAARLC